MSLGRGDLITPRAVRQDAVRRTDTFVLLRSFTMLCSGCGLEENTARAVPPARDCEGAAVLATPSRFARQAKSMGFDGTLEAYAALYDVACASAKDCSQACVASGGTSTMCAASECLPHSASNSACLPPPVWLNLQGIQTESSSLDDAAQLVVVDTPYRDRLLTFRFGLEVPSDAVIRGIQVSVRRAGDDSISDESVMLAKSERAVGADRASTQPWSNEQLNWVDYGGPEDLWGEVWTPEDLNGDGFGLVQSVLYAKTAGNSRAYVDQVRAVIHYSASSACR